MSLCREIVAQHRGEISIDSVQGPFTEVTVDLPLRTAGGTMR